MDEARDTADPLVSPKQVALTYDRVVSAHWRGETDTATAFDAWFEAHWSDQAPPEPDVPPEGTSVLGDSGAGIRWYTRDEVVLGYVSRRPDGCYRVPMRETLPAFMASWDILEREAARRPDMDHLLHQTGTSLPPAWSTCVEQEPAADRPRVQGEPSRPRRQQRAVAAEPNRGGLFETSATDNAAGVAAGT
jgi:hypothetical protein